MKPLRIVIADDEPITFQYLKILLHRYPQLLITGTSLTGQQTLDILHQQQVDIIFLDILMPGINGIDILKQFNKSSSLTPPLFIMLTAYEHFAFAAYNYHAFAYLTKPVVPQMLEQVLADAITLLRPDSPFCEKNTTKLIFQTGNTELLLDEQEIILIEAAGNYLCLHTQHENYIIRNTLKELLQKLPPFFIQVHRSTIVNILHIKKVIGAAKLFVELSDKRLVRISRRCKLQLDTMLSLTKT